MVAVPVIASIWARRLLRLALYLIVALLVLGIVLYFAVPAIARHVLEKNLSAQWHRPVTVGKVAFNPLTLAMRVDRLAVGAAVPNTPALLAIDRVALDVSPSSLWHWAPVLDHVTIEHPRIGITRNEDGSYSIQDLIDAALADDGGPPARFSLNNIEIHDGTLDFDDRPVHRAHEVRAISVGIPFLSSLPYQTAVQVLPHIAAKVNGSPFDLSGTTTPFARERDASLDIDIDALSLTQYLAYLPVKLRAKVVSGTLSTRAKLVFSEGDPQSRSLWLSGQVTLDNFAVQRLNGADAVAVARASAHVARLDFFQRTLVVDSVVVDRPQLAVRRGGNGVIDLTEPWIEPQATPAAADASPPWRVDVEKVAISGGVIRAADEAVKPAYRVTYGDVALDITDLSTSDTKRAHVRAAMTSEFGATAKADIDIVPATLESSGHIAIGKLSLRRFYPYYAEALNLEVQDGSLSVSGDFAYAPDPKAAKFTVQAGEASFDGLKLALPGERTPLWRVPRVALTGIVVDVAARTAQIATLTSRGGALDVHRDGDGRINFERLLRAAPASGRVESKDPVAWVVSVRHTVFDRYAIDIDDRVPAKAVAWKLRDVALTADNLSNVRARPVAVEARAVVGDGGRIAASGPVTASPFSARLRVDASGIALAPLQPYFDPLVNVTVTAGALAAGGRLAVGAAEETPAAATRVRWSGDVTVTDFAALDTPTANDLARWKKIAINGVDATVNPPRVDIASIAVEAFFARVIVHEDATINFVRLLKPPQSTPGAADAAPLPQAAAPSPADTPTSRPIARTSPGNAEAASLPAPPPSPASEPSALPVSIGNITLARGNVRYSDFYIRPNYTADLTDVGGSVSSMSATQAGNVDIAAKVERTAPVQVKGSVNPFARDLVLDVTGSAHDIDLPPLSPYSAKYAGYGITKGKLSFDVHYRVRDRKLTADNKVVLDQLTFGAHVDSPTATKLPVLLAVALLKDIHGVIDVDLPISGSLDDPQFSVGGLIVRVIVNLLQKAVTAPFALLGAAFGGGEELSYIAFDPGSAHLPAAAAAKLDKLGNALKARPQLKVDIAGRNDVDADTEALRHAAVERAIRQQKVKALIDANTPPADAAAVVVNADERQRFLSAAYKEAPIKERPRNFIGMLKDVPAADMEAMLHDHLQVDADTLRELETRRAQAVKDEMVGRGIAPERLFVVATPPKAAEKGLPAARADLALK